MTESRKPLSAGFGGHTEKGSQQHDDRINRYGERRKRARQFLRWLREQDTTNRPDLVRVQADLGQCANWLLFRNYYQVDQIRLAAATTCKRHLVCPFCAARRGSKQVEKYSERLTEILKANPRLKPAMLTLTVANGENLSERFNHLVTSFRKLQERRRDYAKKGRGYTEFSKVAGAVFSYEVTNKGKGWHPHLHAVVLLEDWIDREALSEEWHKITGDSFILDIRRLAKGADVTDPTGNVSPKITDAFCEVFKYALKFSDLDFSDNLHAYEVLRGKRLQGAFGVFWGVKVPESLLDDPLENEPFLEMLYRFDGRSYHLASVPTQGRPVILGYLQPRAMPFPPYLPMTGTRSQSRGWRGPQARSAEDSGPLTG
jgi:plasmid rolling circle replication initiator protein Rep